jgi:hypothetical protein
MIPADAATRLRTVADELAAAGPAPLTVHLVLAVTRFEASLTEAERVAAVDAVASALGLTAAPAKSTASLWEHLAHRGDGGFHLSVTTDIASPRVCACGATCAHDDARAAA